MHSNTSNLTFLEQGMIFVQNHDSYLVHIGEKNLTCHLAAHLRQSPRNTPVSIGDQVLVDVKSNQSGIITTVLPRKNQLSRRAVVPMPGAVAGEQIIAANVDLIIPVFSISSPAPKWGLLDRYLVSAEAAEIPVLICLTKLDLDKPDATTEENPTRDMIHIYRKIGYNFIFTSAANGSGINELRSAIQGQFSILLGNSGVGKTSLLNALDPDINLRTGEISSFSRKGKHTTTRPEIYPLKEGGALMDTPGIRQFGLWDIVQNDLPYYFPEMRPYLGHCKFRTDCLHVE
jgi:ribosome biogenesis GTPase / thiamine phosphate phosphatase